MAFRKEAENIEQTADVPKIQMCEKDSQMSLAHSETFLTSVQAGVPIPFLRKHNLSSLLFRTSYLFGFE